MSFNRYGELLRAPQVRSVFIAGVLAQLPIAMYSLATLLFIQHETGSFVVAGAVAGGSAAACAAVGPFQGRLVDRFGRRPPLVVLAGLNVLAAAALLVATRNEAGVMALTILGSTIGATIPPIGASQLGLWPVLLRDRPQLLDTAAALEVTRLDLFLIVGPLLVTIIAAAKGPIAAFVICPLMAFAGTLRFVSLAATAAAPSSDRRSSLAGPLSVPSICILLATGVLTGMAIAAVRIGLIAFGADHGSATAGGLLLVIFGSGSVLGGLWYGSREHRLRTTTRYVALLSAFAAALLPLSLAGGFITMGALTMLAGLALAPVAVCEIVLLRERSPPDALTETYAWSITAALAGSASANAIAGSVIDTMGWQAVLLGAAGSVATAAAIAIMLR
jgi:predicted MFS family arabinose efflux permease